MCPWILTMATGGTPGNYHSGSRRYHGRGGIVYCQTPVLGLGLGVDFTFDGDNDKNHKNHNNENDNPHLNFVKGTVLGDKEQGVGIRDKG